MALEGVSLPTEGTTLEGKHEYCTTKAQTVLHDGGARRQCGSQSDMDFDLAQFRDMSGEFPALWYQITGTYPAGVS